MRSPEPAGGTRRRVGGCTDRPRPGGGKEAWCVCEERLGTGLASRSHPETVRKPGQDQLGKSGNRSKIQLLPVSGVQKRPRDRLLFVNGLYAWNSCKATPFITENVIYFRLAVPPFGGGRRGPDAAQGAPGPRPTGLCPHRQGGGENHKSTGSGRLGGPRRTVSSSGSVNSQVRPLPAWGYKRGLSFQHEASHLGYLEKQERDQVLFL